jgi:hypothetical protein
MEESAKSNPPKGTIKRIYANSLKEVIKVINSEIQKHPANAERLGTIRKKTVNAYKKELSYKINKLKEKLIDILKTAASGERTEQIEAIMQIVRNLQRNSKLYNTNTRNSPINKPKMRTARRLNNNQPRFILLKRQLQKIEDILTNLEREKEKEPPREDDLDISALLHQGFTYRDLFDIGYSKQELRNAGASNANFENN